MDDHTTPFRLTAGQWQVLQPLFPQPASTTARGRPSADDRAVLEGVLWKLMSDCAWTGLPACYPSHQTCYRRYRQWKRQGLFSEIFVALADDLCDRGAFDFKEALTDGRLKITSQRGSYKLIVDPSLTGTWQQKSILICLVLLLDRLRKDPDNLPGSARHVRIRS